MKKGISVKNKLMNFLALSGIIFLAAMSRMIPHPWNFTAIGAMALLSGSQFKDLRIAMVLPLASLFLSDLALGYHPTWTYTYLAVGIVSLVGRGLILNNRYFEVLGASLVSSVIFYLISNFGVWASGGLYSANLNGLVECMIAGVPFFGGQIAGDLMYSLGLFALLKQLNSFSPEIFAKNTL